MNLLNKLEADHEQNRQLVYPFEEQDSPPAVATRDVEEVTEALRQRVAEKVVEITKHLK